MDMPMNELLSLADLCNYLKLSKHTVYKLTHRREIPASIIGKQLRFRKSKIDEWIEKKEALWMKGSEGRHIRKSGTASRNKEVRHAASIDQTAKSLVQTGCR